MYELNYTTDFAQGVQKTVIRRVLAKNDNLAHTIRVGCLRNGTNEDLTGARVTGYFIRADEATVTMEGTVEGSYACITLNSSCYNVEGRCYIVIKLTRGEVTTTIFWAEGAVSMSQTDAIVETGETTLRLEDLFTRLEAAEAGAAEAAQNATTSAAAAAAAQASIEASRDVVENAAAAITDAQNAASRANAAAERVEEIDVSQLISQVGNVQAAIKTTLLWSGTWESGNINVPGISGWKLLQVNTAIGYVLIVGGSSILQGVGASVNEGLHRTIAVRFTVSGDTCTLVTAHYIKHNSNSNHEALTNTSINAIYGLLKG